MSKHKCGQLHAVPFAIALGATCAIGMLFLGWFAALCDWGHPMIQIIASVYRGFAPTLLGGIIGALWGFADGFIGGLFLVVIYNCVLCHCKGCKFCK